MNKADMLIHVHPDLDAQARTNLERGVMGSIGVDCANFDHHLHPYTLTVKYDPNKTQGMAILNMVRMIDPAATRIGL
jgi:hypothetical protein